MEGSDVQETTPVKSVWVQRGLWVIVGVLGSLLLWSAWDLWRMPGSRYLIESLDLVVGVLTAVGGLCVLFCLLGIALRWGPMLSCAFLGIFLAIPLSAVLRGTCSFETAFVVSMTPGALVGGCIGYAFEASGRLSTVPCLPRRFSLRALFILTSVIAVLLGVGAAGGVHVILAVFATLLFIGIEFAVLLAVEFLVPWVFSRRGLFIVATLFVAVWGAAVYLAG